MGKKSMRVVQLINMDKQKTKKKIEDLEVHYCVTKVTQKRVLKIQTLSTDER